MTECAGCGTRVSARGGQAAAGSSGSEHCRAPPPRLSRPAPVPLPRTAVVCFLTSTCTALNLQTSETELKISITKHLDYHTHNASNYNLHGWRKVEVLQCIYTSVRWPVVHCTAFHPRPLPRSCSLPAAVTAQCSGGRGEARSGGCSPPPGPGDVMPPWPRQSDTEVNLILYTLDILLYVPRMLHMLKA